MTMKQLLFRFSILALLLTIKVTVCAKGFNIDEIYYEVLSEDEKTVIVHSVGNGIGQVVSVPETIEYEGITYLVSAINSMHNTKIKKSLYPGLL